MNLIALNREQKPCPLLKIAEWESSYQFIKLPIYQAVTLSIYQVINLSSYQFIKLSRYQFIKLLIYQVIKVSSYQFIKLSRYQFIKLSRYQFIKLSIYQVITLSIYQVIKVSSYHVINLSSHQVINLSSYQFIKLSSYQFINLSSYHQVASHYDHKHFYRVQVPAVCSRDGRRTDLSCFTNCSPLHVMRQFGQKTLRWVLHFLTSSNLEGHETPACRYFASYFGACTFLLCITMLAIWKIEVA